MSVAYHPYFFLKISNPQKPLSISERGFCDKKRYYDGQMLTLAFFLVSFRYFKFNIGTARKCLIASAQAPRTAEFLPIVEI